MKQTCERREVLQTICSRLLPLVWAKCVPLRLIVVIGVMSLSSGCVTRMLAKRIVAAPNQHGVLAPYNDPKLLAHTDAMYVAAWRSRVGPPAAELAVGVIDPADFQVKCEVIETDDGAGRHTAQIKLDWQFPDQTLRPAQYTVSPKGTLVLLHGIMMTKESMLPWALYFAERHYRVVLVDLRGHGRSSGKRIGFGAWESADLMEVADELERRGLLVGNLGVFGISYGAAVGIHWAARDSRIKTIVALAPFDDPTQAIPVFARGFDPRGAGKLTDLTFATATSHAAQIAGIEWNELRVVDAVRRLRAPVLFFHGEQDSWVYPANSEALQLAAPTGSRRVLTKDDHITLSIRLDVVGPQALAWFDEHLSNVEP